MVDMGFWALARDEPGHLALVTPDGDEVRAGELLASSNQLAHGLRALGLEAGGVVSAVLPNGREFIELYLACLQAGWYLVPINHHLVGPEIAYILEDCEAKALVGHAGFADICVAAAKEVDFPAEASFAVGGDIPGFRSYQELKDSQPTTLPDDRTTGQVMNY